LKQNKIFEVQRYISSFPPITVEVRLAHMIPIGS